MNTAFVQQLIPAMRQHGVKRFLYQAGGFTKPYKERLPFLSWMLKNTIARYGGLLGQHKDNEAVIAYLVEEASDIVHGTQASRGGAKTAEKRLRWQAQCPLS